MIKIQHNDKNIIQHPLAVVIMDVQFDFCSAQGMWGTEETERIAQRIPEAAQQFRALGVPVYAVYHTSDGKETGREDFGGFHIFKPEPPDIVISKDTASVVCPEVLQLWALARHRRIFYMGFNENDCLHYSSRDTGKYTQLPNCATYIGYTGSPIAGSYIRGHVGNGTGATVGSFDLSEARKRQYGINYVPLEQALEEAAQYLISSPTHTQAASIDDYSFALS